MQTVAIVFLVLWFLIGVYIYKQEAWWSRSEALISAVLFGFIMTLSGIALVCITAIILAMATGLI